jgi:hypothetical protein
VYKYYVIVGYDDNSIYFVIGCTTKREAQTAAIRWADSAFVVTVVNSDVMKYSDNAVIKNARKKQAEE